MEWTRVQRTRETEVMAGIIRGAMEGGQISYKRINKLMRKDGLIGHDEHVIAIEYFPFKLADNVRVIVGRSKKVNIDKVDNRALKC